MPLGLQNAYGLENAQQGLRQRIIDQLNQQRQQQEMQLAERRMALQEQEAQRSGEQFKMTQADHAAALADRTQASNVNNAAKLAPQLPMDRNVAPEAAGIMRAGGLGDQLYTPPTAGETESGKPFDAAAANPAMNLGTPVQQQASQKQQFLGRLIGRLPENSPARMGVEYQQATGDNAPAELLRDRPAEEAAAAKAKAEAATQHQTDTQDNLRLAASLRAPAGANADRSRLDKSYDTQTKRLDTIEKPLSDQAERIGRLKATMAANSPQADTLIAPEILSVTAGGTGSGLRMNEAEIARIIGGRNKWETLKATLGAWQADPSKPFSITPEQRKQMHDLVQAIAERGQKRLALIDEARGKLVDAPDVTSHRQILNEVSKHLNDEAIGGDAPTDSGGIPAVGGIFQGGKVLKVERIK